MPMDVPEGEEVTGIVIQPSFLDIINPGNIVIPEKKLAYLPAIFGKYDCRHEITNILLIRGDIIVRTTTPGDWDYIDYLSRNNSWAVGFLPKRNWTEAVWGGGRNYLCFLLMVNGQAGGYTLVTPGFRGKPIRVQQIAVQEDLRRWEYGTALIDVCEYFRKEYGRTGIKLRCRCDLEANLFWTVLGFSLVGIQEKGTENHNGWKATLDINRYERIDGDRLL
jgi:GNAT superfamily N-acetyltransferase